MNARRARVSVLEMRSHVERIVERHGITARYVKYIRQSQCLPWSGGAKPTVMFPVVRSTTTYAVALHELGHVFGWHVDHPDPLVRERDAWDWARFNSLVWTPSMEKFAAASLRRAARRFG